MIRRLTSTEWFFVVLPAVVVAIAASMSASTEQVSWFGFDVPVLCLFRALTGHPCPGCGLTRSFVLLVHGHWLDALRVNVFGPFVFGAMVVQSPIVLVRAVRRGQSGP